MFHPPLELEEERSSSLTRYEEIVQFSTRAWNLYGMRATQFSDQDLFEYLKRDKPTNLSAVGVVKVAKFG